MKVLFAHFSSESSEHSYSLVALDRFVFKFGEEAVQHAFCRRVFEDAGIKLIPTIITHGHPYGPVAYDTFEFIRSRIMAEVKSHAHEIDGIFLFLHGANKVIGLVGDSAEHAFLKEIHEITGPCIPTTPVMDPHGNLSEEFVNKVNILRCCCHSSHTDAEGTFQFVAGKLVELLKNRRSVKSVYREVPIITDGEKSVSLDKPVVSINWLCDGAEKDERTMSASFYIDYLRHNGDELGCSVVAVPQNGKYRVYAEEVVDYIHALAYS